MASTCGSTCPTENGFFANDLNLGGSAILLAVFAFLTPVTYYLGYRFRTPGFSALMATGLSFEVFGFLGRVLLHESRDRQGYFALTLLGSTLGPVFMSGAMTSILPHLLVIYGQGHDRCQSILTTSFLFGLFIVSLILDIVGTVFVAYGYGGVSRDRSADIIAGGLGAQALSLFAIMGVHGGSISSTLCTDDISDIRDDWWSEWYAVPERARFHDYERTGPIPRLSPLDGRTPWCRFWAIMGRNIFSIPKAPGPTSSTITNII
ncbi:uncharacterized protein Triagg1_8600 [Trichoderma aggressivum f. europaeum]|uniref:Uncharacterized protein n=1 Tax=Trichoderma aggressivum f. europaeum TaxID=173218 RepID=A0AAE1IA46_9HYPO|nr:hypothetical protein Triagg1_8600 [Trichoderma aggressivum f. europaeum]